MKRRIVKQLGPMPWPANVRRAYYARMLREVFIYGDTTTIRVILAVASVGYTVGLWLPLHTFERKGYALMASISNEWVWGGAFLAHAMGVFWRIIDVVPRNGWAFAINAYGFGLWFVVTGMIMESIGEYSPGVAMELTVLAAAFIALVRTGLNDEKISP